MSTILESREGQQNTETSGPKCNRCYFDITWSPEQAQVDFGKNRPYEKSFSDAHDCPKDENGNITKRQGYELGPDGKKVICLIAQKQQTRFPSSPQASSIKSSDAVIANLNDVKRELAIISNNIGTLAVEQSRLIQKQNDDIVAIKGIVEMYVQHNPVSTQLADLIGVFVKLLPNSALGPRPADEYAGMESV